MTVPTFTMRELIEAGVHFGHNTRRWNPKMAPYIYGIKDKVHIIDLQKTVPMLYRGLEVLHEIAKNGGKILFVGTKNQAQEAVAAAAVKCGQYYINHRWLGGLMTNYKTVSHTIARLKDIEKMEADDNKMFTKKELLDLAREKAKLESEIGGIVEMGGVPDAIFVVDILKEHLALEEAHRLQIPIVAICDTNSNPQTVDYPIPGNDDATRSIELYCNLAADSILEGIKARLVEGGVDLGASEKAPAGAKKEDSKEE
jgi:small subunit ribosomal protein S2